MINEANVARTQSPSTQIPLLCCSGQERPTSCWCVTPGRVCWCCCCGGLVAENPSARHRNAKYFHIPHGCYSQQVPGRTMQVCSLLGNLTLILVTWWRFCCWCSLPTPCQRETRPTPLLTASSCPFPPLQVLYPFWTEPRESCGETLGPLSGHCKSHL